MYVSILIYEQPIIFHYQEVYMMKWLLESSGRTYRVGPSGHFDFTFQNDKWQSRVLSREVPLVPYQHSIRYSCS